MLTTGTLLTMETTTTTRCHTIQGMMSLRNPHYKSIEMAVWSSVRREEVAGGRGHQWVVLDPVNKRSLWGRGEVVSTD